MRAEYVLGQTPQHQNSFQASFWWLPNIVIILNPTSNPVFLNRGNNRVPSTTSFDVAIPAGATVRLPYNSREFGGFLPLSPALSDTTQVVTMIFDQVPNA